MGTKWPRYYVPHIRCRRTHSLSRDVTHETQMSSLSFAGHRVVGGGASSSCLRTHSIHCISTSLQGAREGAVSWSSAERASEERLSELALTCTTPWPTRSGRQHKCSTTGCRKLPSVLPSVVVRGELRVRVRIIGLGLRLGNTIHLLERAPGTCDGLLPSSSPRSRRNSRRMHSAV